MNPKVKMKISTAVADYMRMFPEDWELCAKEIEMYREGLIDGMAEIKGQHALERHLFSIPEKLSVMIGKKLEDHEAAEFKGKEASRWFTKEFPQFAITKHV